MIRLGPGFNLRQDRGWRNTDSLGQLDHIDAAFAALDPGNQRLMTMKALGHPGRWQAMADRPSW